MDPPLHAMNLEPGDHITEISNEKKNEELEYNFVEEVKADNDFQVDHI